MRSNPGALRRCSNYLTIRRPVGAFGGTAAACVTVNTWPPTTTVPERVAVVEFAATLYVTDPEPVPVGEPEIVIHDTLLAAVHEQPVDVVTENVADPPAAVAVLEVGLSE